MDLLSNIRLFIKVAEKGSFSEAARLSNISTASVTRQISFLEKEINTRLLQRSTRHVSLTDSGRDYYLKIIKVIEQLDEVNDSINTSQNVPTGILKISCPTSFALKYIIPYIPEFHYLYPNLKLNLSLSDNLVNLVEEEVDVAIRIGALKDSSMIIYPLTSNKRVLCASPEYINRFGKPESIEDLYNHKCLVFKSRPAWYFFKDSKITELKPNAIIEINSGEALQSLTVSGLGISVLTLWLIKKDLEKKKLEILLPDYHVNTTSSLDSEIYILYPNKKFLPLKVKLFIDFIKNCMTVNGMTHS